MTKTSTLAGRVFAVCFAILMIGTADAGAQPSGKTRAKAPPGRPVVKKPAPAMSMDKMQEEIIALYNDEEWPKVIELATAIHKQRPRDTAVNTRKVVAYAMTGNKQMASKTVVAFFPDPNVAATMLGTLPTLLSDEVAQRDAIWYTEEAIRVAPGSPYGYTMKGAYLVDDSNYAEALIAVGKAWSLATDSEKLQLAPVLPGIEQRAGAGTEAYKKIDDIRSRNPGNADVAKAYYQMLIFDKRYPDALAAANAEIAAAGGELNLYWRKERAYLYGDMQRPGDACADVTFLVNAKPGTYETLYSNFDCPEAYADLRPAAVKEYVYGVDFNGSTYDFVVTPETVDMNYGVSFDFKMTNEAATAGKISMTPAALDTAHAQMNMFSSGAQTLTSSTSVWISKAVYRELKDKGFAQITAGTQEKRFDVVPFDAYDVSLNDFEAGTTGTVANVSIDGIEKKTKVIHLRSSDGEEHLWINDDPQNPMIVAMNLGWKIGLREVHPK